MGSGKGYRSNSVQDVENTSLQNFKIHIKHLLCRLKSQVFHRDVNANADIVFHIVSHISVVMASVPLYWHNTTRAFFNTAELILRDPSFTSSLFTI